MMAAKQSSKLCLLPMNIIAAVDINMGIGKENALPWHLPKEYKHFVRTTTAVRDPEKRNAVLMGRRCWESIPAKFRPLKGRLNIVLSRTMAPVVSDQLIVVREMDEMLAILAEEPFKDLVETIWNVGGHDIYALGLAYPALGRLVLTKLDMDFHCDVHFPEPDWARFGPDPEHPAAEERHKEKWNGKEVSWHVEVWKQRKGDAEMATENLNPNSINTVVVPETVI